MSSVSMGFSEHVDKDVEELDVGTWPPGHETGRIDVECGDRRIRVLRRLPVAVDDLGSGFVGSHPHQVEMASGIVPATPLSRKRPSEDVAEIPRLGNGEVLDEAEKVGAGVGKGPANVVL